MAAFIFTSNSNSVLVDIDGKQAAFGSNQLHPYTPDRAGNVVFLYDIRGIIKNSGQPGTFQNNNRAKDRIPIIPLMSYKKTTLYYKKFWTAWNLPKQQPG